MSGCSARCSPCACRVLSSTSPSTPVLHQLRLHEQRGGYIDHTLTPQEEAADYDAKHQSDDEEEEEGEEEGGEGRVDGDAHGELGPDVSLAALREVEEGLESVQVPHVSSRLRWVVVDLQCVNDMDTSGMHGLEAALKEWRGRREGEEVEVVWVAAQQPVRTFLVTAWQQEHVAVVGEADEVQSWFVSSMKEAMERVRRSREERMGAVGRMPNDPG